MLSRTLTSVFAVALCGLTGCQSPESVAPVADRPAVARAPASGNGGKQVFPFVFDLVADCGGQLLDNHVEGWVQVLIFDQPGNRNVELNVFHSVATYSNVAGETFVFHDVGPDHYYLAGDDLIIAITGRSSGSGVIGHVVINLVTGQVLLNAGFEFGSVDALACAALS